MAVGTRTAPVVAIANIVKSQTTVHMVDASGDAQTDTIITPALIVDADVETWVAAYQASTQTSIWKVTQSIEYVGDKDASNAGTDQRNSIADGINLLMRENGTLTAQTLRLIAPIAATMQGNQDIPLLASTELAALIVAALAMMSGYSMEHGQFTGRRERKNNTRILT